MNRVFVLDKNGKPLDSCHPARARKLLDSGRAAVYRMFPFTIIIKDRTVEDSTVHKHRVKIDPGSEVTGFAVIQEKIGKVVFAAEIEHRGRTVKARMTSRGAVRRSRRSRKTRYRKSRHDNRTKAKGWLPPSLLSRIGNILVWVNRAISRIPIAALSQELVKFDTQLINNPEISGVEYQQGTLADYELREYLLEKWNWTCAYCGKKGVPLQKDHVLAKSRGGSNAASNYCMACEPCNQAKGNRPVAEFLKSKPDALDRVLRHAKTPLKDAAAMNATRWALYRRLKELGLPVECGTGGRTKFNRTQQGFPKAHWIDAACVGISGRNILLDPRGSIASIKATGRGTRQVCQTDEFGFPNQWRSRFKRFYGFQTGDIVCANNPKGKYPGIHIGRVTVRSSGSFRIGSIPVWHRHTKIIQCIDGYQYSNSIGGEFHE